MEGIDLKRSGPKSNKPFYIRAISKYLLEVEPDGSRIFDRDAIQKFKQHCSLVIPHIIVNDPKKPWRVGLVRPVTVAAERCKEAMARIPSDLMSRLYNITLDNDHMPCLYDRPAVIN